MRVLDVTSQLSTDDGDTTPTVNPLVSTEITESSQQPETQPLETIRDTSRFEQDSSVNNLISTPTDDPASWVVNDDLLEYVIRRKIPQNIGDFSR